MPRSIHPASATRARSARVVAVVAVAVILAGCGGSGDDDAATTSVAAPASTLGEEPTAEPVETTGPSVTEPPASTEPTEMTQPDVANGDYLGSYTLVDDEYGTVVSVTVAGGTRTIESNTLPNHETGEFPNAGNPNAISEQDRTWQFATEPVFTGVATWAREPGVALNGVKYEPDTAEVVECASGESYRIEGLQDMYDLGMDLNNAHVQPTGEYHYHGASELLAEAFDDDADLVLVGFAADGHLIYSSKSGAYASGYTLSTEARTGTDCTYRGQSVSIDGTTPDGVYGSDWTHVDGAGDLDECNGTEIEGQYAYLVTQEYPYVPRCLMGEFTEAAPVGVAPGAEPAETAAPDTAPGGGPPDLSAAAAAVGVSAEELGRLLGGPPPDVDAAATALGLTPDELLAVLAEHGAAPPSG